MRKDQHVRFDIKWNIPSSVGGKYGLVYSGRTENKYYLFGRRAEVVKFERFITFLEDVRYQLMC